MRGEELRLLPDAFDATDEEPEAAAQAGEAVAGDEIHPTWMNQAGRFLRCLIVLTCGIIRYI